MKRMSIKTHKKLLKEKLDIYDDFHKRQDAILEDDEVQTLFNKNKDDEAAILIAEKYGDVSTDTARKVYHELMKVIFLPTNIEITEEGIYNNWTVCQKAIDTTRKFIYQ